MVNLKIIFLIFMFLFLGLLQAETHSDAGNTIALKAPDGSITELQAAADDDGDGIDNALEINGFTYSVIDGLQVWNGDSTVRYFITDPLKWSTDGDPYSDFMEVSGINMPSAISAPENHPLVAARPVIQIKMTDYDVIPLATISNSKGGEESSSFTNEVSNSNTVSASVTVEAELNPFKLVGGSVTASYSHTWTNTQSSTSSFGSNWNNTRTTQPDQAARLKLRIYMENQGGATALNVVPTINLSLGDKTIATFTPNQTANILTPPGTSDNRFPKSGTIVIEKDGDGNDIVVTLNELRAIQMGTPLSLEVIQVSAQVVRWNSNEQDWNSDIDWASFESEIDPVTVDVSAELGNGENFRYQVFSGTPYWDPEFTFEEIISLIFDVTKEGSDTFINGRKYPDEWYLSTPTSVVLDEWEQQGRPQNLLNLRMFRNSKMVMMSPGASPSPEISLASYTGDYKSVLVSALPNNFPILSVEADVYLKGEKKTVPLVKGTNSFYENEIPFESVPEGTGMVKVTNARGDVTSVPITLPSIYSSAQDVKDFSSFLPDPGGEYWIYPGGNEEQPMLLYCLFFDPESHAELEKPREYLTVQLSENPAVYSDYIAYSGYYRSSFSKLRINPNTLKLAIKDHTFAQVDIISGADEVPSFVENDITLARLTWSYPETDSGYAAVNLSGTPYHFAIDNAFTRHADETISIDRTRQKLEIKRGNLFEDSYNYYNFAGFNSDSLQLVYGYETVPIGRGLENDGNALRFNQNDVSGYVRIFPSEALNITEDLTIEAWIYPTGKGVDDPWGGMIINKEGEYELFRRQDGLIMWAVANVSPGWIWQSTQFKAPENQWLHIAMVYDRNEIKTYFNGKLFHSMPGTGNIDDYYTNMNQLWLGGRQANQKQRFQGLIDEVRIWNRARSASEIESTYSDTLNASYYASADSGLVGYWRMDKTEVDVENNTVVADFSVHSSPGELWGDVQLTGLLTDMSDIPARKPQDYSLNQNYPNPFNPVTTISYNLKQQAQINLTVYNMMGQKVKTLVNNSQKAGSYKLTWNGTNDQSQMIASGTYIYRMIINGQNVISRKMILVR